MARRGLTASIPIWVRVAGIIALVLVGVLVSTLLLGAAGDSGGHGRSGDKTQINGSGHGSGGGGSHSSGNGGGGHGSGTHGR